MRVYHKSPPVFRLAAFDWDSCRASAPSRVVVVRGVIPDANILWLASAPSWLVSACHSMLAVKTGLDPDLDLFGLGRQRIR